MLRLPAWLHALDVPCPLAPLLAVWPRAPLCQSQPNLSFGRTPAQSPASWQAQRLSLFACLDALGMRRDGADVEINRLGRQAE
jgi:hypothetical protein